MTNRYASVVKRADRSGESDGVSAPTIGRRTIIKAAAAGSLGAAWGSSLLAVVPAHATTKTDGAVFRFPTGGYGPLITDPVGVIDLPEGFRYVELAHPDRTTLDDGGSIPARPDALGSFVSGRSIVLASNHELNEGDERRVPTSDGPSAVPTYNAGAHGGVSVLTMNRTGTRTSHRPGLAGTVRNCAGGVTPWGTWLTCEETEVSIDGIPHGYVFELDPIGRRTQALPYKAMGRFSHEAAAVDPRTSEVYLTEDNGGNALLYRFQPADRSRRYGSLGKGGTLSALRVPGVSNFGELKDIGTVISKVAWTPTPTAVGETLPQDSVDLRSRFADDHVTRGQKLEGAWWFNGALTFVSSFNDSVSSPGLRHEGQVFRYDPSASTLTLLAYLPVGGRDTLDNENLSSPDNISVSKFGGVVWCEDGNDPNRIGALDVDGQPFCLARSREKGELCGVHFSPDGRWLFVNQQIVGRTLAITGPWTGWARVR